VRAQSGTYGWDRMERLITDCSLHSGVFLNYSYLPPDDQGSTFSAPRTFLPLLSSAAHRLGGFPNWLGNWYASTFLPGPPQLAASAIEEIEKEGTEEEASAEEDKANGNRTSSRKQGSEVTRFEKGTKTFGLGDGRCWAVRGKQWRVWTSMSLIITPANDQLTKQDRRS
jgi:hypothetical protein